MPGDVKTAIWAPVHDHSEDMDIDEDRPSGIPPPSYQEAYTAPELPAPTPIGPSWTRLHSAPRDNFKNCAFLRAPEPIIAKIMTDYCGKEDVLRLRHTSRTFMRIFSEKLDFQPLWLDSDDDGGEDLSHVWTAPNCTYPEQAPSFCPSCLEVQQAEDPDLGGRQLWCRGCRDFHSELHFSHLQRGEQEHERVCIGREGHVRLCSHFSLNWAQVRGLASSDQKGFACKHNGRSGRNIFGGGGGGGGGSCHSSGCLNDNRRANCAHVNCGYSNAVAADLERNPDGTYSLRLVHLSHVPFARGPAGEKPSWHGFARSVHEALANPQDEQTFMPARVFAGCDPLRAFDPNHCSCLDWHVAEAEEEGRGPRDGFKWLLADRECGDWRDNAEGDEFAGARWNETDPDTDRCVGARHGFDVEIGRRDISIDFLQCADDGNMLVLQQVVTMIVEGPTDPAWEDLVDADSVMRAYDTEMLGKTWCFLEDTPKRHTCAVGMAVRNGCTLREAEWLERNPEASVSDEDRPLAARQVPYKTASGMLSPLQQELLDTELSHNAY